MIGKREQDDTSGKNAKRSYLPGIQVFKTSFIKIKEEPQIMEE
jgi:hypothetical protein